MSDPEAGEESGPEAGTGTDSGRMQDAAVTACTRCPKLVEGRSQIVNGVGATDSDLCFVGEAPGAQEDERGEPFVGRSGSILDEVLEEVGLDREGVRITNCVRCRPPDNRDPHVDELANCAGWLAQELTAVDPELVVTLGKVPAQHLLDRDVAITSEAGSIVEVRIGERRQSVLLCLHPAATLYDRSKREPFRETIERAAELVGAVDGGQVGLGEF